MDRPRLTEEIVRGLVDLQLQVLETDPDFGRTELWAALKYIRRLREWYRAEEQAGKTPS